MVRRRRRGSQLEDEFLMAVGFQCSYRRQSSVRRCSTATMVCWEKRRPPSLSWWCSGDGGEEKSEKTRLRRGFPALGSSGVLSRRRGHRQGWSGRRGGSSPISGGRGGSRQPGVQQEKEEDLGCAVNHRGFSRFVYVFDIGVSFCFGLSSRSWGLWTKWRLHFWMS